MRQFWKYFKIVVLAWGFACLGLTLYLGGWLLLKEIARAHAPPERVAFVPKPVLDQRHDDLRITVTVSDNPEDSLHVGLYRQGQPLVRDFLLHNSEPDSDSFSIRDARVIPVGDGSYRILLFSHLVEHELGDQQIIWFLKYDGKLRQVHQLEFFGMTALDEAQTQFLGNTRVSLPAMDEDKDQASQVVVVPTRLSIGNTIRLTPLLSVSGRAALRTHYGQLIETRLQQANAVDTSPELMDRYMNARRVLDERLADRAMPY